MKSFFVSIAATLVLSTSALSAEENLMTKPTIVSITNSWSHACALYSNSKVKCWGGNFFGQLGDGISYEASRVVKKYASATPTEVVGLENPIQIAAAGDHTCALLADRTVKCWGVPLTHDTEDTSRANYVSLPKKVAGLSQVKQITASEYYNCALLLNGTVTCWGLRGSSVLQDGSEPSVTTHTVAELQGAVAISSSLGEFDFHHSCAVMKDKTVKCWDWDAYTPANVRPTAVTVPNIKNATQVLSASRHGCAVLSNSQVKCWLFANPNLSATVSGLSNVVQLSGGEVNPVGSIIGQEQQCALQQNGQVKCWTYGYRPDLEPVTATTPEYMKFSVSVLSASNTFKCALLTNQSVKCWGYNMFNNLGFQENPDLPVAPAHPPVTIKGL